MTQLPSLLFDSLQAISAEAALLPLSGRGSCGASPLALRPAGGPTGWARLLVPARGEHPMHHTRLLLFYGSQERFGAGNSVLFQ